MLKSIFQKKKKKEQPKSNTPATKQKVRKKIVFIVDDDPFFRKLVKDVLIKEGYSIMTAKDVDEALQKLKDNTPDFILLDVMMPGKAPFEIVKKCKKIKIAYLTSAEVSKEEKENLLKQKNIVAYIQKPFTAKDLLKTIKSNT